MPQPPEKTQTVKVAFYFFLHAVQMKLSGVMPSTQLFGQLDSGIVLCKLLMALMKLDFCL
jgi:hypothetical protein